MLNRKFLKKTVSYCLHNKTINEPTAKKGPNGIRSFLVFNPKLNKIMATSDPMIKAIAKAMITLHPKKDPKHKPNLISPPPIPPWLRYAKRARKPPPNTAPSKAPRNPSFKGFKKLLAKKNTKNGNVILSSIRPCLRSITEISTRKDTKINEKIPVSSFILKKVWGNLFNFTAMTRYSSVCAISTHQSLHGIGALQ